MFKKVLIFGFLLSFNSVFAEENNFQINFASTSQERVRSGEEVKINWWIKKVPITGRVQLFLSGRTDRNVPIASSGYYKGKNLLTDQVNRTASGVEKFSTEGLPSGKYQLNAYICDYSIFACETDRYSLNRYRSNTLNITIENNNSVYLDFDKPSLRAKTFGFNEPITFKWLNERYENGFLTFKLEGGDGTIYDIVIDSTEKNEARNDISGQQEIRYKNFKNKSFTWTSVNNGTKKLYKIDESSPYWNDKIILKDGLYRLLMYVHRNINSYTAVENYLVKSMPFQLRKKVSTTTAKQTEPAESTDQVDQIEPEIYDPIPNKPEVKKKKSTTPSYASTKRPTQRLNRRQLLELYKTQINPPTFKKSKLSLAERIAKKKKLSTSVKRTKKRTKKRAVSQRYQRFSGRSFSSVKNRRR